MNKTLFVARWLLVAIIIGSAIVVVSTALSLWREQQVNAYISAPEQFETAPDDPRAQFARAGMLVRQGNDDQALDLLTKILGSGDETLMPLAYYNRGNINLREALTMTGSDGRQIPLAELAKQDYRSALAIDHELWDVRYNLEVALRVVPEDPADESDFEKKIIHSERSIESKAFKVDLP